MEQNQNLHDSITRRDFMTSVGVFLATLISTDLTSNVKKSYLTDHHNTSKSSPASKDAESNKIHRLFETLAQDHPLVSNLFARGRDRISMIDSLITNFIKVQHIIANNAGEDELGGYDSEIFMGAWAILESCLQANIVANPGSKTYNAAGLYQYIPDTRRTRYSKFRKAHPDISIKNDRKDPYSNLLVTQYNLKQTQKNFDNKTDFALRAHHAGASRVQRYYDQYMSLTGIKPVSMMDWYDQILPREIVDQFMRLKDNSFIYVAQVVGAQSVYRLLQQDPQQVQAIIDHYKLHQITTTKGSGIDDINYIRSNDVISTPLQQDIVMQSLINHVSQVCDLNIYQTDIEHWKSRDQHKLATSAIIKGRGTKIIIPFSSIEAMRLSGSPLAIKYKRLRYLLELARIHGLCSVSYERLPSGQLVNSVGLVPDVSVKDIAGFAQLNNHNQKPLHDEEVSDM